MQFLRYAILPRMLPANFVHLKDIDNSILQDIKYLTDDNFIGRPIAGYQTASCVLTREAATALVSIQRKLLPLNMSLKVFDGYRPQTAVNDFIQWSQDVTDQKMKQAYYPKVNKADFFTLGYLAKKSSHSRGSTVDLTIVKILSDQQYIELDMGTKFDFLDELSHPLNPILSEDIKANRMLLRHLMEEAGFSSIKTEWWHFTLKNEPYPDTYFDFIV
jgi:D-alanyl-D-alanine dipeptidase